MEYLNKKHESQMVIEEVNTINNRLAELSGRNTIDQHAYTRMKERNITKEEVYVVFKNYKVIEFQMLRDGMKLDMRVLIMGRIKIKGKNLFLSISLITGRIYTVWADYEKEPNLENYNENLNIRSMIKWYKPTYRGHKRRDRRQKYRY